MSWFNILLYITLFSTGMAQFANTEVLNVYDELASSLSRRRELPNQIRFNDAIVARIVSYTNYPQEDTITFMCEVVVDSSGSAPSWVSTSKDHGMFGVFIIDGRQYKIRQRLGIDGAVASHYLLEAKDTTDTMSNHQLSSNDNGEVSAIASDNIADIQPNSVPVKIAFEFTSKVWRALLSKPEILAYARFLLDGIRYVFGPAGFDLQLGDIILRDDVLRPDGVRAGQSNKILASFRGEQNKPANSNVYVYFDTVLNGGLSHVGLAYYGLDSYLFAKGTGEWLHQNRFRLTHELGHMLGEGHTNCGSVMLGCTGVTAYYGLHQDQVQTYKRFLSNPRNTDGLALVADPTWKVRKIGGRKMCAEFDGGLRGCNKQADCMRRARQRCSSGFFTMEANANSIRCCQSGDMLDLNTFHMYEIIENSTPYEDLQSFNAHPELERVVNVDPARAFFSVLHEPAVCWGPGHSETNQKLNAGAWYPDRMNERKCAEVIAMNPDSCPTGIMEWVGGSEQRCRCCEVNYDIGPAHPRHRVSRVSIASNCGAWGSRKEGTTSLTHQLRHRGITYQECRTRCENNSRCQSIRYDEPRTFCDILATQFGDGESLSPSSTTSVTDFTRRNCGNNPVPNRDCTLSTINPESQCDSSCPLLTQTVLVPSSGNGHCAPQTHQCVSGEGACAPVPQGVQWIVIDDEKACEKNAEGITRTFGRRGFTLDSCKKRCQDTGCQAIDFYFATGWCNLFNQACTTPRNQKDGSSSHRIVQAASEWESIHESRACEGNQEGIRRTFGRRGFTLESCQARCVDTAGCVAIDFYFESSWCNLFNEVCTQPRRSVNGASSWKRTTGRGRMRRLLSLA